MTLSNRKLERIVKGCANQRWIQILGLLSLQELCGRLAIGLKTASEHVRHMTIAGLVLKRNDGRWVRHKFTDRGTDILIFCKNVGMTTPCNPRVWKGECVTGSAQQ